MHSTTSPKPMPVSKDDLHQKPVPPQKKAKRGPGYNTFNLHGGERSAWAREVLEQLTHAEALALDFTDKRDLYLHQVALHTMSGPKTLATRSTGLRLYVWQRSQQIKML